MVSSISVKQGDNLRKLRNCVVCIICGKASEAEAIAKALNISESRLRGHEVAEVDNGFTFYIGKLTLTSGEEISFALTSSTRQGIQSFAINAALLIHILRPRFVVHAGVCAAQKSVNNEIKLCDVIFGEAAVNFEEGKFKWIEDKETQESKLVFCPDYNMVRVYAGDIEAFAGDNVRPGYHYGTYISGSAVHEDAPAIFQKIASDVNRNVKALDMEASAFFQLCQLYHKEIDCLGVVKGVSDYGDGDKGKDPTVRLQALQKTAEALMDWIQFSIPAISWEVDYSKEPAAEILPGYYDNFVRPVLDNVIQGLPVTEKVRHISHEPEAAQLGSGFQGQAIRGLKIVLPKDNQPKLYKTFALISSTCQKYNIMEVEVGGKHKKRTLYFKDGYLIDFPRTVNKHAGSFDAVHQVEFFGKLLESKEYFDHSAGSIAGEVCVWEDFISWLEGKDEDRPSPKANRLPVISKPSSEVKVNGQLSDVNGKD